MKKKTGLLLLATIVVTIIFFSYSIALAFDSSQYVYLAEMFTKNLSFQNWQPVRSFVFPLGIHILNVLFGKNQTSLLIGTYIFYIIMLVSAWYMYRKTIGNQEHNKIIKVVVIALFVMLVMFNPIIFGFYHVLLTEFASITIAILMCYLAWNWISMDFQENRLKYSIYSIIFAVLTICSWHLKQPYILTSLVPLMIAMILSFIKDHSKSNIIQRVVVLVICLVALTISIMSWNALLKFKKVSVKEQHTSGGLLGSGIIEGISEYRIDPNQEDYTKESVEKDSRIKEEDREKILRILNQESQEYKNFILLDYGTCIHPIGDRKVIYTKEQTISTLEGIQFWKETLLKEPMVLLKSYLSNYLAIIDIFDVGVIPGYATYYINKEFHWEQDTEITSLGYATYRQIKSDLGIPPYFMKYSEDYICVNTHIKCVNQYMVKMQLPAKILFKFVLLIMPLLAIIKTITYFATQKKQTEEYRKMNQLIIILYMYALAQMILYVVLGSLMDRYAVAPYTATVIAMLLHGYTILRRKKYKIYTERKEKNHEKMDRKVRK